MYINIAECSILIKVTKTLDIAEISALKYVYKLKKEGATRYLVFVNKTTLDSTLKNLIYLDIQAIINKYSDRFSDLLLEVKFTNLLSNTMLKLEDFNYTISL